jgi:hypothetical protein
MLVGHHDGGVADPDLGMPDAPRGVRDARPRLGGPERSLVEVDRGGGVLQAHGTTV